MRKFGKSFHCIGYVESDPGPGLYDCWSVYIARTRDGKFYAYQSGADTDFGLGNAKEAFEWILGESGLTDTAEAALALEGKRGFRELCQRLCGDTQTHESNASQRAYLIDHGVDPTVVDDLERMQKYHIDKGDYRTLGEIYGLEIGALPEEDPEDP